MNILINSDHASSRQGTGISTYALTLAQAAVAGRHKVAWLSGAPASDRGDPLADAAAVSDFQPQVRGPRAWAQTASQMIRGVLASKAGARPIVRSDITVDPYSSLAPHPIYLAPELYVRAHYRHTFLRAFTEVTVNADIDILHLTAPLPVKMRGVKTVVTIHDLVPIRLPYTTPDDKNEFVARIRRSAQDSDIVVTVSEASKADLVSLLDIDPAKVAVTYQSCALDPLSQEESAKLPIGLARFGLTPSQYILFVGAQEPKKNLKRLVEAYLEVDTAMPLVLAGPRGWLWESNLGAALAPLSEKSRARVRLIGYVDSEDLRRLYAGAAMLAIPSLYEGFGLPALEAMNAGCPVLATKTSSLPEICGEAALFVNPFDRNDIRDKLELMLSDIALRQSLAAAGKLQAKRFSFETYVERLCAIYARLT